MIKLYNFYILLDGYDLDLTYVTERYTCYTRVYMELDNISYSYTLMISDRFETLYNYIDIVFIYCFAPCSPRIIAMGFPSEGYQSTSTCETYLHS